MSENFKLSITSGVTMHAPPPSVGKAKDARFVRFPYVCVRLGMYTRIPRLLRMELHKRCHYVPDTIYMSEIEGIVTEYRYSYYI